MKKAVVGLVFILAVLGLLLMTGCVKNQLVGGDLNKTQAAARPKVSLSAPAEQLSAGETVSLYVAISGVSELYGFQFDVAYDPAVFEFQKATEGTFLNNNGETKSFCVDYVATPGLIRHIACIKLGGDSVNGSGSLEKISFKAIASGKSGVSLQNVKLAKQTAEPIEADVANTEIVVN